MGVRIVPGRPRTIARTAALRGSAWTARRADHGKVSPRVPRRGLPGGTATGIAARLAGRGPEGVGCTGRLLPVWPMHGLAGCEVVDGTCHLVEGPLTCQHRTELHRGSWFSLAVARSVATPIEVARRLRAVHDGRGTMSMTLPACDAMSGRSRLRPLRAVCRKRTRAAPMSVRLELLSPLDSTGAA